MGPMGGGPAAYCTVACGLKGSTVEWPISGGRARPNVIARPAGMIYLANLESG